MADIVSLTLWLPAALHARLAEAADVRALGVGRLAELAIAEVLDNLAPPAGFIRETPSVPPDQEGATDKHPASLPDPHYQSDVCGHDRLQLEETGYVRMWGFQHDGDVPHTWVAVQRDPFEEIDQDDGLGDYTLVCATCRTAYQLPDEWNWA